MEHHNNCGGFHSINCMWTIHSRLAALDLAAATKFGLIRVNISFWMWNDFILANEQGGSDKRSSSFGKSWVSESVWKTTDLVLRSCWPTFPAVRFAGMSGVFRRQMAGLVLTWAGCALVMYRFCSVSPCQVECLPWRLRWDCLREADGIKRPTLPHELKWKVFVLLFWVGIHL